MRLAAIVGPGCSTPTNAQMRVTWDGDRYTQAVALSEPTSWTHTYTTAAEHKCSVRVSNEVSSVDFVPPLKWVNLYSEPYSQLRLL